MPILLIWTRGRLREVCVLWTESDSKRYRIRSKDSERLASKLFCAIILPRKLTIRRTAEEITGFEAKFDGCCVVMEPLTKNTYVLVVSSDPRVGKSFSSLHRLELTLAETAMIQHNIYHAQVHMGEFSTKNVLDRKCG
jgi:hypothetical protein